MKYIEALKMVKQAALQKRADPYKPLLDAQRASSFRGTNAGLGLTRDQQQYIMSQPSRRAQESAYDDYRHNNIIRDAATYYAEQKILPQYRARNFKLNPRIKGLTYSNTMRAIEPSYHVFEDRFGNPDVGYNQENKNVMNGFWKAVDKSLVPKGVK